MKKLFELIGKGVFIFMLPAFSSSLYADKKETVPTGILKFKTGISLEKSEAFFNSSGNSISGREYLANIYRLDLASVTGGYNRSETNYYLSMVTGLFQDWSIEIEAVGAEVEETGNVQYDGTTDTTRAKYFNQLHKPGSTSGMKNLDLMLLWEPLYQRSVSLLFGLGYTYHYPSQNFDKPGKPLLSSGINYLNGLFQLTFFSRQIPYEAVFQVYNQNPQKTVKIKLPDNSEKSYSRRPKGDIRFVNIYRHNGLKFTGQLSLINEGNSEIDNESLDDSRRELLMGLGIFITNYFDFIASNGGINEYEIGLKYDRTLIGYQTPLNNRFEFIFHYLF